MKPVIIIAIVVVFLFIPPEIFSQSDVAIAYRQLTLSDFQGTVGVFNDDTIPEEEKPFIEALTSSSFRVYWEIKKTDSSICQYEYTSVDAYVVFNPKQSWMKEDQKTESTLNHEQRHFDIAEINARILKDELLNYKDDCPNGINDIEKITEIADEIAKEISREFGIEGNKMGRLYDVKTNFGQDEQKQVDWNLKIDCMLKNNDPLDYCLSLTEQSVEEGTPQEPEIVNPIDSITESYGSESTVDVSSNNKILWVLVIISFIIMGFAIFKKKTQNQKVEKK